MNEQHMQMSMWMKHVQTNVNWNVNNVTPWFMWCFTSYFNCSHWCSHAIHIFTVFTFSHVAHLSILLTMCSRVFTFLHSFTFHSHFIDDHWIFFQFLKSINSIKLYSYHLNRKSIIYLYWKILYNLLHVHDLIKYLY